MTLSICLFIRDYFGGVIGRVEELSGERSRGGGLGLERMKDCECGMVEAFLILYCNDAILGSVARGGAMRCGIATKGRLDGC